MPSVTLPSFDVDAEEIAAAQYFLDIENARRAAQDPPLDPFANPQEYLVDRIKALVDSWLTKWRRVQLEDSNVQDLWRDATDAQRAAAVAALTA